LENHRISNHVYQVLLVRPKLIKCVYGIISSYRIQPYINKYIFFWKILESCQTD
jgi:hypothetical protein